jgi:hypothetical protein
MPAPLPSPLIPLGFHLAPASSVGMDGGLTGLCNGQTSARLEDGGSNAPASNLTTTGDEASGLTARTEVGGGTAPGPEDIADLTPPPPGGTTV